MCPFSQSEPAASGEMRRAAVGIIGVKRGLRENATSDYASSDRANGHLTQIARINSVGARHGEIESQRRADE